MAGTRSSSRRFPKRSRWCSGPASSCLCYGFSNTNPTHQAHWAASFPRAAGAFEKIFVSWQLGLRKPERAAFDKVCEEMGVRPGEVLFFDDTLENVEGARAAGLEAVWVRGPTDVRHALQGLVS